MRRTDTETHNVLCIPKEQKYSKPLPSFLWIFPPVQPSHFHGPLLPWFRRHDETLDVICQDLCVEI